jgi:hypothetical protein
MKNSYGNYVVQKALKLSNGHFKVKITNNIKKCLDKLTDKKIINKWTNILENMKSNNLGSDLLDQHKSGLKRKKSDESLHSTISNNNSFNSNNSFQSGNSFIPHSANNENFMVNRNFSSTFNFANLSFNNPSPNNALNSLNYSNSNNNRGFMGNMPNNREINNPLNNIVLQNNTEIFPSQFNNQFISRSAENSPNMINRNMGFHNNRNIFYFK